MTTTTKQLLYCSHNIIIIYCSLLVAVSSPRHQSY
eukprot:SAG22_NODE_14527_length_372_cov_0.952381_1_plen_34_part_10